MSIETKDIVPGNVFSWTGENKPFLLVLEVLRVECGDWRIKCFYFKKSEINWRHVWQEDFSSYDLFAEAE